MAEGKKSFLLYADLIHTVKKMPRELRGDLFLTILEYVNDLDPDPKDLSVDLVFETIKQQLKRDLKKYTVIKEVKSESGKIGNLKRWNPDLYDKYHSGNIELEKALEIAKHRKTSHSDNSIANIAVNDSVTVSDNVSVSANEKENNIINNSEFSKRLKSSSQWLETTAMKNKVKLETVVEFVEHFEDHLITMQEQKDVYKDFTSHFVHWFKKQDLSQRTIIKNIGSTNQKMR